MKKSKKIGDASIRVLETLKFLYQNNASIQDIIWHFEKIDVKNKIYTNEVILKYINTLKVFGFKFLKDKDKYVLTNGPNGLDFNQNDLNAILLLHKYAESFPEIYVRNEINEFIKSLQKHFSERTQRLLKNSMNSTSKEVKLDLEKYEKQIREYEKYCVDKQRLKITYKNNKMAEISIMIEPIEIKYLESGVYLSVYNQLSAQIQDIHLDSITKIEQLPLKSNPMSLYSSVTFKLKDRLAKNYKLHGEEKIIQLDANGDVIIQNQKEDRNLLIKRLVRYGELCEVISPKTFRSEMKSYISATLANYVDLK